MTLKLHGNVLNMQSVFYRISDAKVCSVSQQEQQCLHLSILRCIVGGCGVDVVCDVDVTFVLEIVEQKLEDVTLP